MKRSVFSAAVTALCLATVLTSFTACRNVANIGVPTEPTVPTTVNHEATTTTALPTEPTVTTTTAVPVDAPSVSLPTERRSPDVTYFVPASAAVSPTFFDDAVIIGDSITLKLSYYNIAHNTFSNATFLTAGSLGVANALWDLNRSDAVHPSYQGQTVRVPDGVAMSGAKKVYIMLGTNDLGLYGVDKTVENFEILAGEILQKNPGVTMYVQSMTPMYKERGSLTNAAANEYNAKLSELCRKKGWYFVDVASVLRDSNGWLPPEYCSDPDSMGIHFTDTACQIWADYLYTHTAS